MSLRLKKEKWEPQPYARKLTLEETKIACDDLVVQSYPCVERGIQDPAIAQQNIALFSFYPAETNDYGILGFAKVRGVFATEEEATTHSRQLIRKFDSANPIHQVRVGRPFPVCGGITKLHKKVDKIVIDEELERAEGALMRKHLQKEHEIKKELDERVRNLEADVQSNGDEDPVERYNILRHKIVSVAILYEDYLNKIEKFKDVMIKTVKQMREMETPHILENFERVYDERMESIGVDSEATPETKKIHSYFKFLPPFDFLQ
jgi:hypothetical protein